MSYCAIVTCKNSEKTIGRTLISLYEQTIKPLQIIVIDDGSTDNTPKLLDMIKFSNSILKECIQIIKLPDKGYDIRRVVNHWNKGLELIVELNKKVKVDYVLISADDVIYPENYCNTLLTLLSLDDKLAIISGSTGILSDFPEGGGRFISMNFLKDIDFKIPPYYGYEPWLVYKAMQLGYKKFKLNDLFMEHLRERGTDHKFIEMAPAMKCLGYHWLYVLGRCVKILLTGTLKGWSLKDSINLVSNYFNTDKYKNDEYFHMFEEDLRKFVSNYQVKKIKKILRVG